jgi:hypothetical protein
MEAVFESISNVSKRQKLLTAETDKQISSLLDAIENCKQSENPLGLKLLQATAKTVAAAVTANAKDYHTVLGKHSKVIDKKFKAPLDDIWNPHAFDSQSSILAQIVIQHLIREGRFDVAECFAEEAGIMFETTQHEQFLAMYHIQEAMRRNDIQPAIDWATKNSDFLRKSGSALEFKLHQLRFLELVRHSDVAASIDYARKNFPRFADRHMNGKSLFYIVIQQLLCSIIYRKKISKSPYAGLYDSYQAISIQTEFARQYSHFVGQSYECPLYSCVSVGSTALPMIMKISSLIKDKALEWSQAGELPVTIPLLDSQRYHSVFVCPVSKEQGSEANPPMLMVCGHVISKESLSRLSKGSVNTRFKCPYCPVDSTAAQAVRVYF